MQWLSELGIVLVVGILVENVVLTRAFDISNMLNLSNQKGNVLRYGLLLTFVCAVCTIAGYFVSMVMKVNTILSYFMPFVFIAILCLVYFLINMVILKIKLPFIQKMKPFAASACFNTIALGVMLLNASRSSMTFLTALAYGLGGGLGFLVALLFVAEGKRRIRLLDLPEAFSGLPVVLVYIGILSLTLYGLIGHQLAA